MAGHSKWHNIKHRKAAQDAKKGKIFTMHAKLIALAAQNGGNPDDNPALAEAILKAKQENVPNDNIERAIKKGTGEDKDSMQIYEINYEGYGPSGVAMLVKTLTDNKNRTAPNIRHIFSKYGGNLGEPGSVSWMFEKKGVIIVDLAKYSKDELEELILETQAEDFREEDTAFKIITADTGLLEVRDFLNSKNIDIEIADIEYIASNDTEVTDFDVALKIIKMIEAFEEDEDVESVYTNHIISPKLEEKVYDFIEKNTFRT